MKIIRVFPRKTRATPTDSLAYVGSPDMFARDDGADAVHVSVAFTWDIPKAERLAKEWEKIAPVSMGGPAFNEPGSEFVPGHYLKPGFVITSRGCPNRCWFCSVWRREGQQVRELPITDGWNLLDDNLLACSETHVLAVFAMLQRQKRRVEFTGGLEASRLSDWHVDLLAKLKPRPAMFVAYDTPGDLGPLFQAGRKLQVAGFTTASHRLRCYVLIGYAGDTLAQAELRLHRTMEAGFFPMAMLYRPPEYGLSPIGEAMKEWRKFQRLWARPAIVTARNP